MEVIKLIIVSAYLLSLAGSACFFIIRFDFFRSDVLARAYSRRLAEKRDLRVRWGNRNDILLFVCFSLLSVLPFVNSFFAYGLCKFHAEGRLRKI